MKAASTTDRDATSCVNYRAASIGNRARSVEAGAAPITRMTPIAVIPRTSADEHAANEPLRAVITVGGASIRVIRIVAVGADRRRTYDSRPNSHSDRDSLGMGRSRWNQEKSKHRENCENLEIFHLRTPRDPESISAPVKLFITANRYKARPLPKDEQIGKSRHLRQIK